MSPTSSPDVSAQIPAHRCRNSTACPVQASIVLPISASCKMRNFPKSGDVYKTKVYVRTVTRGFQGLHSRNSTPCLAFAFIVLPVLGSCAFCNLPRRGDMNVPDFIAGRVGTTPGPSLPEFNSLPCSGINRSPRFGKLRILQLAKTGRHQRAQLHRRTCPHLKHSAEHSCRRLRNQPILPEHVLDAADRLTGPRLVLYPREAHVVVSVFAESDPGRHPAPGAGAR